MATLAPVFGTAGVLVAFLASTLFGLLPGGGWRLQLGLTLIPASAVMLCSAMLVETPRWLLSQGKRKQAEASMRRLFPTVKQQAIDDEISLLSLSLSPVDKIGGKEECQSVGDFLSKNQKSLVIGIAINVAQQICGINVVMYYGPTVLTIAGFGKTAALATNLVISIMQVGCVAATGVFVDRVGRRPMAIVGVSFILVGITFLIFGFFGFALTEEHHPGLRFIPVTLAVFGIITFRTAFSFSLAALPFVVTSEIFSQDSRAIGVSIAKVNNWMANFLVSQSFPMLQVYMEGLYGSTNGTGMIFCLYFGLSSLVLVFLILWLPETAGIRLEEASRLGSGAQTVKT